MVDWLRVYPFKKLCIAVYGGGACTHLSLFIVLD